MHETNLRSFGSYRLSKFAELGDRLATECSTKMPQEHQQERALRRQAQ